MFQLLKNNMAISSNSIVYFGHPGGTVLRNKDIVNLVDNGFGGTSESRSVPYRCQEWTHKITGLSTEYSVPAQY